ncbi:MAG TPA: hypothetical protein VM934_18635 [Pyrinomonadaceae bacterium]|jgi:hypothetical protein|nr:hypothetical protein [Pyrinomonadaceae bacterium]
MSDLRNWLEELSDKIPGYSGYAARERRRDVDKLHREHLADRLRAAKQPLTDVLRELTSGGRLMEVGPVDRVLKKIDHAENRVRFAAYGYSGLFDAVKIEEAQLNSIYQFDLALVDRVEEIERQAGALAASATSSEDLKRAASELERALDEMNRAFDERTRAISDFSQGAPGASLFNS